MTFISAKRAYDKTNQVRRSEVWEALMDIQDSIIEATEAGNYKTEIYLKFVCEICEVDYDIDFAKGLIKALLYYGYRVIFHETDKVLEISWERPDTTGYCNCV